MHIAQILYTSLVVIDVPNYGAEPVDACPYGQARCVQLSGLMTNVSSTPTTAARFAEFMSTSMQPHPQMERVFR
jgi:hypothetical protein